jgi:hypothetical protein
MLLPAKCVKIFPWKFQDFVPHASMGSKHAPVFKTAKAKAQEAQASREAEELANPHTPTPTPTPTAHYTTEFNDFGHYR